MRKDVCTFGGSYDNHVLWYNDDTSSFFIDQYHYGVIDDEEHFDGTKQIDTFSALKTMIQYNKLRSVLMYQNELNLSRDLNVVLGELKKRSSICDDSFLADPHLKYYVIADNEYAIYYQGTFFSVKDNNQGVVDFSVVRRILENYKSVVYYEYGWNKKWVSYQVMDVSWL